MSNVVDRVLEKLSDAKKSGSGWSACCPAHEDSSPSLSINEGDDGRTLIHCHAGCTTEDVCAALGLKVADLMPPRKGTNGKQKKERFNIVATYDYRDENGEILMQAVRLDPKDFRQRQPKPGGGWNWSVKGVRVVPYNLPAIIKQRDRLVAVVEGEKDVSTCTKNGILATCNAGGAKKWTSEHATFLDGRDVVILEDNDGKGRKHARKVAVSLHGIAKSIKIISLPGLLEKGDITDWFTAGGTKEKLSCIVAESPEWEPSEAEKEAKQEEPLRGTMITNAETIFDDDGKPHHVPIHMNEIKTAVSDSTGDWPRRMHDALFVHDHHGVSFLIKSDALFGFLHGGVGGVEWHKGAAMVTKGELHADLRRAVTKYKAVENLPHFPPMAGHYYACKKITPGDGAALDALIDRFNPTTQIDRDLILAMFVTPFLGTAGGTRPAWVITSDDGRGSGKTKLAEMVSLVAGGALQVSHGEDITKLKERLLTPSSLTKRVVVLDNIKSLRFSWDDLEGLITAPIISGRQLYHGDFERPNMLVWLLTLNGASLSTDMAQRVISVQISRPTRSGDWEEETRAFIHDNHDAILADIAAFFQRDRFPLAKFTRWATWEREVIERLPEPGDAQATYMDRQAAADVEEEESAIIRDYFREQIERLRYDADIDRIHIPNNIVADWFRMATGERQKTTTAVSRTLNQMNLEGRLPNIIKNPSNSFGRGFIWIGDE